ncbi:TetR/AcrR family transcriptional regulator [Agromyces seonyuensis]|uniref:TetR family transcriptional regulator n=1 Tax=Agromyces seonyuensis TaxID=2662446 RepID=A0A6I4P031_9MICO|nr:TetR/AcrR family transcriptional regulator [Agromyces seonyuensis]MWB99983.1 TetR family transcriptional regulator [Agromyces seonyuensis]
MARREYDMTGRSEVAARTRERLIQAAREGFFARRYDDVTLADLASAAGVSVQTLLNHFGSKEGLLLSSVEAMDDAVADLRGPVEPGDVGGAVAALVRHYEVFGDANWRFVADLDRHPRFEDFAAHARDAQRAWLEQVFGPRLPAEAGERALALDALYAATDVGTWKLLRRDLGLDAERTGEALRRLIVGQLDQQEGTEG